MKRNDKLFEDDKILKYFLKFKFLSLLKEKNFETKTQLPASLKLGGLKCKSKAESTEIGKLINRFQ